MTEKTSMRARIISDGTPGGTKVLNAETGEPIAGITRIDWTLAMGGLATAVLHTTLVAAEVEAEVTFAAAEVGPGGTIGDHKAPRTAEEQDFGGFDEALALTRAAQESPPEMVLVSADLRFELDGVLADMDVGREFGAVCRATIVRVRDALTPAGAGASYPATGRGRGAEGGCGAVSSVAHDGAGQYGAISLPA